MRHLLLWRISLDIPCNLSALYTAVQNKNKKWLKFLHLLKIGILRVFERKSAAADRSLGLKRYIFLSSLALSGSASNYPQKDALHSFNFKKIYK